MSDSFTIPPLTVPKGVHVFGPRAPGAGLRGLEIDLDIGNLVAPCEFKLEYALDGVTWQTDAILTPSGPPVDRHGNPVTPPTMTLPADFGDVGGVAVLTTADTLVRVTTNNTQAFASSGGSITTY